MDDQMYHKSFGRCKGIMFGIKALDDIKYTDTVLYSQRLFCEKLKKNVFHIFKGHTIILNSLKVEAECKFDPNKVWTHELQIMTLRRLL